MEISLQRKEVNLECLTDKFTVHFEVEGQEFDEGEQEWKNYKGQREVLTQVRAVMSLTERSSLPVPREWYEIYLDNFYGLTPDISYRRLSAHPEPLDSILTPDNTRFPDKVMNIRPEILGKVREAFLDHNVNLKVEVYSALRASVKPWDSDYDMRDLFRPAIRELVDYVIQQALQEVTLHAR